MTDNEQPSESKNDPSWLHRQWRRLRSGQWRDVVITQVGEGSKNVAAGKNIFQINVGGHNITPYILVIMVALLVMAGYLFYPFVEPLWNPSQMEGSFKIAVADFGQLEGGQVKPSRLGADLSKGVATELQEQYDAIKGANSLIDEVVIWHDSQGRDVKNVRFGVVEGATPEERSAEAEKLARRVNANMVIYGNLTQDENPEGLVLEFFYRSPSVAAEPDITTGSYRLGSAITSDVPFSDVDNAILALRQMSIPLSQRTAAIFWLTQAMTYDFANEPERALKILQAAEQNLEDWLDPDGKEVFYYFLGRAALFSRDFDAALAAGKEALRIEPDYVNAHALLGLTYMDRAQLHFASGRELSPEEAECTDQADFARASPTLEEAIHDAEMGVEHLAHALELAPTSHWPPIEPYIQMNYGLAERVLGLAYIFDNRFDEAQNALTRGESALQQSLAAFPADDNPQYYAWAQMGLGLNYRLQAHLAEVDAYYADTDGDGAAFKEFTIQQSSLLGQTIDAYQACIDQGETTLAFPIFHKKVFDCSCIPYRANAQDALDALDETGG